MNTYILRRLLVLIALLLPEVALAWFEQYINFSTDKSVQYLGQIFGQVGTVLTGQGNDLFGSIFEIFNVIVFSLGSIVLTYTTLVSLINSAQEGEVMGKKWSSIWIPLRSALGMGFLLPLPGGYSLIQCMMMWIVIQGVGAANQLWLTVLSLSERGVSTTQSTSKLTISEPMQQQLAQTVDRMFLSMLCKAYHVQGGVNPSSVLYYVPAGKPTEIWVGDPNASGNDSAVCGKFYLNSVPADADSSLVQQAVNAVLKGLNGIDRYAENVIINALTPDKKIDPGKVGVGPNTVLGNMPTSLYSQIRNSYYSGLPTSFTAVLGTDIAKNAYADGWLFAGAYYYYLSKPAGGIKSITTVAKGEEPLQNKDDYTSILNNYKTLVAKAAESTSKPSTSLKISSSSNFGNGGANRIWNDSFGKLFVSVVKSFTSNLTTNDSDPLASMQYIGASIMQTIEFTFIAGLIAVAVIQAVAGIASWTNPVGFMIAAFIAFVIPFATALMALLWTAAAGIGLYLPLIPYMLFLFGGIGWIIGVIETMVAAPIVALGIASPTGSEHLGKAEPAVMLITNMFLRPSLMVIGFLAASKLFVVAINILNFSFMATLNAQNITNGIGLFSSIALIILYAGIAITITHKSFGLIHQIPDRVLRWIGGQAEQFGEASKADMEKTQATADKGFEASKSVGVASMNQLGGAAKAQAAKLKKGRQSQSSGLETEEGDDDAGGGGGGAKKKGKKGPMQKANELDDQTGGAVSAAGGAAVGVDPATAKQGLQAGSSAEGSGMLPGGGK